MKLQEKIDGQGLASVRWYGSRPSETIPVPVLGPDLFDPRDTAKIEAQRGQPPQPAPETSAAT
jgi:NADH-quinone oxidoreductase subunit B